MCRFVCAHPYINNPGTRGSEEKFTLLLTLTFNHWRFWKYNIFFLNQPKSIILYFDRK